MDSAARGGSCYILEMTFQVRDLRLPDDESAARSFIMGLQRYERAFEADRRLDPAVADEYFAVLMDRVATNHGRVFVAEQEGCAIGWAVFVVLQNAIFVAEEERTYGYIDELFVSESARSHGVGRSLIAACENEARRLGLRQVMIGVLAGNQRAAGIYARSGFSTYSTELRKYL